MNCLRCGYCCYNMVVVIVKPEALPNPDFNDVDSFMSKLDGEFCPHLSWDGDNAICTIHHYDWYHRTPCYEFTQIGSENEDCRLGKYTREKHGDARNIAKLRK